MNVVDRARMLAENAHRGQVDKAGRPYILHPMAVANMVTTEQEKVVALLHDVIEDGNITAGFIRDVFGEEIATAVKVLTHDPSENYTAYIRRIKEHLPLPRSLNLLTYHITYKLKGFRRLRSATKLASTNIRELENYCWRDRYENRH